MTNMGNMMLAAEAFNQPLSLDSSSVIDTSAMLPGMSSFNQPVRLETSLVRNMRSMFSFSTSFNQPLDFNTSSVRVAFTMLKRAESFNQPIDFDTSSMSNVFSMFRGATQFNQNLCSWGEMLDPDANVESMFNSTSCPLQEYPILSNEPPGPFCYSCDSTSSEISSGAENGTSQIVDAVNNIIDSGDETAEGDNDNITDDGNSNTSDNTTDSGDNTEDGTSSGQVADESSSYLGVALDGLCLNRTTSGLAAWSSTWDFDKL